MRVRGSAKACLPSTVDFCSPNPRKIAVVAAEEEVPTSRVETASSEEGSVVGTSLVGDGQAFSGQVMGCMQPRSSLPI